MIDDIWKNPLMLTDCYNLEHWRQKVNQDWEWSHIYNRSKGQILYGLNELVLKLTNFKVEENMIIEAEKNARKCGLRFPTDLWFRVINELKGRVPLRVQALRDGTWCPKGTPFCQISNTEKGFGELVTWFEAILLHMSFASGCATRAFEMWQYLNKKKLQNHKFHSFGLRGHRSLEDAYWAGTAWVIYLKGSDDFHISQHCPNSGMHSIPALAHKVVQQYDKEMSAYIQAIDNAMTTFEDGPGITAIVIDTYDPHRFINKYLLDILQYAMDSNVHVVFRPDSGNVLQQTMDIWNKLYEHCRYSKDVDVMKHASVIIGEGMTFDKAKKYDKVLEKQGIPLDFVNYGIGSGFYNDINRDWVGDAMKTAYSNGKPRMKFSADPLKRSIPGQVNLQYEQDKMIVNYSRDGLYYDIYYYDERSTRPKTTPMTWDEIRDIALVQTGKQKSIILSQEVKNKIVEIGEEYLIV